MVREKRAVESELEKVNGANETGASTCSASSETSHTDTIGLTLYGHDAAHFSILHIHFPEE